MTPTDAALARCPVHGGGDLVDPGLYGDRAPYEVWDHMRAAPGLQWSQVDDDRGFWSAVRFADAETALGDYTTFTSERGTLLDLLGTDDPVGGTQLAATDPPKHTEMQTRLKKALAVRSVERQRDMIRDQVLGLIEPLGDGGAFDFAQAMMALPMNVIGTMMGVPRSDWEWLTSVNTSCIAPDDPDFAIEDNRRLTLAIAHHELFGYFQDLVRHRRDTLGDDLISVLITTEFDGRTMSVGEIVSNCYSLLLGGLVTTPHAPNHVMANYLGTDLLTEWAEHAEDVETTAVEEALRLGSPVLHFLRYAKHDTELGGTRIAAGDAVVAWLGAANRDEAKFTDATRFDLRRKPNKHLAFGAGPHYCIGHSAARVTLKVLFRELLARYEDFRPAGDPVRLRSNFVSGYKHVPITARRRG